ncbi:hypothetical protein [Bradyrhizobium sp. WU425]|uniref:hypothetical protein n=1 Tax=Bradyrhizobium sp. WU425 TaxID=187029 RepID=UPI001E311839|nr:hypothetical protein [Bradyrhizobium canariense]UFW75489.1 hypothetical protein BcanWU425_17660 [Bradyrhizobium canariense]
MIELTVREFLQTTTIPLPWPNDVMDMIEGETMKAALAMFFRCTPAMDAEDLADLVSHIGRETKRFALSGRERPSGKWSLQ